MLTQTQLKQELYSALRELGLSDQEIELYTVSMSLGPVSIATLADHLHISRPNVYKIISSLEAHGLANFSQRKKYSKTFVVEQPSTLLQKFRDKKKQVNDFTQHVTAMMPDLYSLYHQGDMPTRVRILKSEAEYIRAVEGLLNEVDREVKFFGSIDDFIATITPQGFDKFTSLRIERGVVAKTLIPPSVHYERLQAQKHDDMRELRVLSQIAHFNTSFQLSKHKIIIWQPMTPLALLVDDEHMVKMMHAMFDLLWNIAE